MIDKKAFLLDGLRDVKTSTELERWVRTHLRRFVPHASFLGTFGKLYGAGSVVTHRVGVDFPLNLAEEMKDRFGAIDDPLVCGWFHSGRVRFHKISELDEGIAERWREVLQNYGMCDMLVFGHLDHEKRRFALFQICNLVGKVESEIVPLMASMGEDMAKVGWASMEARVGGVTSRRLTGHPTASLTTTEIQIVGYLSMGLSNKEIARRRGVSSSTIKTQVSRTGAKLGASRRSEIVAIGMSLLSVLPAQNVVPYEDFD